MTSARSNSDAGGSACARSGARPSRKSWIAAGVRGRGCPDEWSYGAVAGAGPPRSAWVRPRVVRPELAEHSGRRAPDSLARHRVDAVADQPLADRALLQLHRGVGQERLNRRFDDARHLVRRRVAVRTPIRHRHHGCDSVARNSQPEDLQAAGHPQAARRGIEADFFGCLAQSRRDGSKSPGSADPPGKLISPACVLMCDVLAVSRTRAWPSASGKSRTSTADGRPRPVRGAGPLPAPPTAPAGVIGAQSSAESSRMGVRIAGAAGSSRGRASTLSRTNSNLTLGGLSVCKRGASCRLGGRVCGQLASIIA
jgi:hypothetical protein